MLPVISRLPTLVVALFISACGAPRKNMALPIQQIEINYYVGDSITGGGPNTPYYTTYQADTSSHTTAVTKATTSPTIGATSTKPTQGATQTSPLLGSVAYSSTFTAQGFPGADIGDIILAEHNWLVAAVAANATIVYVEAGINNVAKIPNTVAAAQAETFQLIADIHAALPNALVVWVTPFCDNEQHPNANDANIALVIDYIEAAIAANSSFCYLFDVRTAQQAYEALFNVPAPGASEGVLTIDGVHPNAAGVALMTTAMESQISYQ